MSAAAVRDPIDEHLAQLAARLPGGVLSRHHSLLLEARDGLEDTAEAYREAGLDARQAAERAVAEFGDVDELTADYSGQLMSGWVRVTALVLGLGYTLILTTWGILGRLVPDSHPNGSSTAAASFSWIGTLSIAITVLVGWSLRQPARAGHRPVLLPWVMGLTGILTASATLVASYLVQPWGSRDDQPRAADHLVSFVETVSALVTFGALACSLHCLWTAWSVRRSTAAVRG